MLKDRLHLLVEKRFRGELNKCQDARFVNKKFRRHGLLD